MEGCMQIWGNFMKEMMTFGHKSGMTGRESPVMALKKWLWE